VRRGASDSMAVDADPSRMEEGDGIWASGLGRPQVAAEHPSPRVATPIICCPRQWRVSCAATRSSEVQDSRPFTTRACTRCMRHRVMRHLCSPPDPQQRPAASISAAVAISGTASPIWSTTRVPTWKERCDQNARRWAVNSGLCVQIRSRFLAFQVVCWAKARVYPRS